MTFVVSTPAWATAISCAKLTGRALGVDEFKIYGCAPKMAGYKFVTGIGTDLTTTPGPFTYTWTWSNGTTTVVSISVAPYTLTPGNCPTNIAAYHGFAITGSVTAGTSTYTAPADPISMTICRKNASPHRLYLVHGTTAHI